MHPVPGDETTACWGRVGAQKLVITHQERIRSQWCTTPAFSEVEAGLGVKIILGYTVISKQPVSKNKNKNNNKQKTDFKEKGQETRPSQI